MFFFSVYSITFVTAFCGNPSMLFPTVFETLNYKEIMRTFKTWNNSDKLYVPWYDIKRSRADKL
jgi:hypothetical protein